MGWVFLQVFLAFGVGVLIVWWTWPKTPKIPKASASSSVSAPSGALKDVPSNEQKDALKKSMRLSRD